MTGQAKKYCHNLKTLWCRMNCALILAAFTMSQLAVPAAPTADLVLWQRGEDPKPSPFNFSRNLRVGVIDSDGNFVPACHEALRAQPAGSGHRPTLIANRTTSWILEAYEHRSGSLVPGRWGAPAGGTAFVPEIGAKVLDLASRVGPGKIDRLVYNRPKSVADFWTADRKVKFEGGLPNAKLPPAAAAAVPPGWELVPFGKAYPDDFPDGVVWFTRVIGDTAEYGHLDAAGEFIPDYGLPVVARSKAPEQAQASGLPGGVWRFAFTLPSGGDKTQRAYEYRSGRLIEGVLHDSGNFAPQVGTIVRDFKDYNTLADLPVYNLPGVLRKKPSQ